MASPNETSVAPVVQQDWLTRLNAFLNEASKSFTHTPGMVNPLTLQQAPALAPAGGNLAAMVAPAGHEEQFRKIGEHFVESTPRTLTDVAVPIPGLLPADMALQGYGSAQEAGLGTHVALESAAINAAIGKYLPAITEGGSSLVARGLARTPLVNETAQRVGEFVGGQAAQGLTLEAQKEAQNALRGRFENPLTAENVFETALNTVPLSLLQARGADAEASGVVGPDGIVNIPLTRTQVARGENALAARQEAEATPASPEQALLEGPPPKGEPVNVTEEQESPLSALRPNVSGEEPSAAHEEFIKAAGLDSVNEPVAGPMGVDLSLTTNRKPPTAPEVGPYQPWMQANFGDPKQATPLLILDRLLAGEITPTGIKGNENNVNLVNDLQRAFVTEPGARGESFVNMQKVQQMAELAQRRLDDINLVRTGVRKEPDPEITESWDKLNTIEKTGAIAAANILQDPYAVMGKDPTTGGLSEQQWGVQPVGPTSFLRTVHNSAGALYKKWNQPVKTVSDAGLMVRDVNYFVENVKKGVEEHYGPEGLEQLTKEAGFQPVTLPMIQSKYDAYLTQYLHSPDEEAAARTLQTVKNKVLIAANSARNALLKSPKYSQFGNPPTPESEQLDQRRDSEYKAAVDKLPQELQFKLNNDYTKFRQESMSKQGEAYWKLDAFRDAVIKGNLPLAEDQQKDLKPSRVNDGRLGGKRGVSYDDWLEQVLGQKQAEEEVATPEAEDEAVAPEEQAVAEVGGKTPVDEGAKQTSIINKYFDGTPRDPQEVMQEMPKLQFEALVETATGKKFSKILVPLALKTGQTQFQLSQSGEGVQWVKDFLAADYSEDADQRAAWAEKSGLKYDRVNNNWKDFRRTMFGRDEAKTTWLKARLMGLTPKEGVTPDNFLASTKKERATRTKAEKFTYDVKDTFYRTFLDQGYQPELAAVLTAQLVPLTKNFAGLDNASFAQLTDKKQALSTFENGLKILGAHLPNTTIIDGKPVLNSIVAVAMQDYIDNKNYAAFNGFIKLSTVAHEQYHAFAKNVVDNPNFGDMNADTAAQVEAVRDMRKFSESLDQPDRIRVASALIDSMIPPKYTRGEDGKFTPEVQGLIQGATRNPEEFVAFYYQMVATGLASRVADSAGKQGVAQSTRIANDMRDAMMWLTKDEQSFIRGQFRNLGDMLEGLQKVLDDPEYRKELGYVTTEKEKVNVPPQEGETGPMKPVTVKTTITKPPSMSVGTTAVEMAKAAQKVAGGMEPLQSARVSTEPAPPTHYELVRKLSEVDIRVAKAEAMLKQLEVNINTPDMFEAAANGQIKEIDVSDLPPTKEFMLGFGGPKGPKTPEEIGRQWWNGKLPSQQNKYHEWFLKRWFAPFQYRTADLSARGLKVAEQARQTLGSVQPMAHLLNHSILDSITERFGKFGDVKIDTTKDFFKFINNGKETDPNARAAVNKIIAKQQELKGVSLTDQSMQGVIQQALANVAPPKRPLVTTAVKTINDAYATMRDLKFKSAIESQRNLIAQLAMVMNPGKLNYEQAKEAGTQAIAISESGDLNAQKQWVQTLITQGYKPETAAALLSVASNGWGYLQQLNASMKALGNFASEARVGPYILQYTDKAGDRKTIGIKDTREGETKAGQLLRAGATDLKKVDQSDRAEDASMFTGAAGDKVAEIAKVTFDKQVAAVAAIDPDIADFIKNNYDPSAGIAEYKAVNAVQQSALRRSLKGGREDIDYIETMIDQASRTSVALSRRAARQEFMLQRTELSQMGQEAFARDLDSMLAEVMAPSTGWVDKLKTVTVAKDLVKPASAIIEGVQMLSSGNAMLYQEGLSTKQVDKTWRESVTRLIKWNSGIGPLRWNYSSTGSFTQTAKHGESIEKIRATKQKPIENKEASVAYALQRMNDEGRLGYEPILDVQGEDNLNVNLARATRTNDFSWESMGDMASNSIYNVAKNALRLYGIMPRMNNWLAAAAALDTGYDKGLRGDALQTYALGLKDRMAVSGGRENRPLIFAKLGQNKIARPAVALASLMSTYTLGMTTIMARSTKEALMGAPGLTPPQRIASAKTAGYVLSVQLAMAGALGLPGTAAALWAVENTFHVDAEVAIRKFVKDTAEWLGADKKMANVVSDSAINGVYNSLTGMDYAARAGTNSLFGINGYNGFDPWGVTGPVGGMAKDAFNALTVASQGQFGKAASLMAPDGLKPLVDMFNNEKSYGDNRQMDTNGNLIMKPTTKENIGMALGFTSHRMRQAKQENRLLINSNKRYTDANSRLLDGYASPLVRNDPNAARNILDQAKLRVKEPGFDQKEFVRNIVDRAVDMVLPRDPTASGPTGNQAQVSKIGQLFNEKRPTEIQRLKTRDYFLNKLGFPFEIEPASDDEIDQASFVDHAIAQRGLTRQQALDAYRRLNQ